MAVKDIEKQLKALLLAHHATIKDLKKQVTQMNRKLAIVGPKKSPSRGTERKTRSRGSKSKTSKTKSRRR
ncbi:MAG TPA: hypothetical protein VF884_00780 [Nitrososphaeraceae archaeon]